MTKWQMIAVLCLAALSLPAATLDYRFEKQHCDWDVCGPDWNKGLIFVGDRIDVLPATGQVFEPTEAPLNTRLWEGYRGIYVRPGIPVSLGYLLAVGLPLMLFATAAFLGFRRSLTRNARALT